MMIVAEKLALEGNCVLTPTYPISKNLKKTDEQLEPYLCELLEWIQDINWPGAMLILGRLKHFSGIKLKEPVENAVKKAKGMQVNGLMWIDYLSELLDNESLEKCLSKATLTCLQQHYHNWAAWYQE